MLVSPLEALVGTAEAPASSPLSSRNPRNQNSIVKQRRRRYLLQECLLRRDPELMTNAMDCGFSLSVE